MRLRRAGAVLGMSWFLCAAVAGAQEGPESVEGKSADEKSVKGAGKATKPEIDAEVVKEEEGVKTFKFDAVEV